MSKIISKDALAEFAARAFAEDGEHVDIHANISGIKFLYDEEEHKFFEIDAPSYHRSPMSFYIDYMRDIKLHSDGHITFTDSATAEDFSLIMVKQSRMLFDDYVKD